MDTVAQCSIHELAKKVRKRRFQEHTIHSHAHDQRRHAHSLALLARLARQMRTAHLTLCDCFRAEAKREFGERYAALMTDADALIDCVESRDRVLQPSWMLRLEAEARDALLTLLTRIRRQPAWVAQQIAALSPAAMDALASLQDPRNAGYSSEAQKLQEETHPYGRRDALSIMLFGVFAQPGAFASEDAARFDLAATLICALLRDTSASSQLLRLAIMDQFADAYGWAAQTSAELLLMSLLQSSVKLLHRQEARHAAHQRANQQRFFHLYSKRDEAEEEFFANAMRDVFRLLDSEDDIGIPSGALHLARLVYAKLSDSEKHFAEAFLVRDWFFDHFLGRVLKIPEAAHVLHEYYISAMQRQTILEVLHQKILGFCSHTSRVAQQSVRQTGAAETDGHWLSIVARFVAPADLNVITEAPTMRAAALFGDVSRPSFQLCYTEVVTLAQSLVPNQRSNSPISQVGATNLARNPSHGSTSSKASLPARARAWSFIDLVKGHEAASDQVSTEKPDPVPSEKVETVPDAFTVEVGDALRSISLLFNDEPLPNILVDALDTIQVSTDEALVLVTGSEREDAQRRTHRDDLVKNAIYKLIDNVDLGKPTVKYASADYFATRTSQGFGSARQPSRPIFSMHDGRESQLLHLLLTAGQRALSKCDYVLSELYHQAYNHLQAKSGTPEAADDYSPLLYSYMEEEELLLDGQMDLLEQQEAQAAYAHDCKLRLQQRIDDEIQLMNKLRLKMWYVVDVRRSRVWQQAWEVCKCLHRMRRLELRPLESVAESGNLVVNQVWSQSRDRRSSRFARDMKHQQTGVTTGLYPVDPHIFEALAVPPEQGGSNKLTSGQAELVLQWMKSLDIHNFCIAEERLHRLCYEMDDLMRRLLRHQPNRTSSSSHDNEDAASSPLWSFELFNYESGLFNIPRSARPTVSFFEQLQQSMEESSIGLPRRGSAGDLLSLNRTAVRQRGNSVGSIDKPRSRSRTRFSLASDVEFSQPSPERPTPTSCSQPLHRQISMTSTIGSNPVECDELGAREFMLQARVGLTALLLSDMAELLFYEGSETDEWHNSDLVDAVLSRKKREEDLAREKVASDGAKRTNELPEVQATKNESRAPVNDVITEDQAAKRPAHGRMKSATLSYLLTGGTPRTSLKSALAPPSIDIDCLRRSDPMLDRARSSGSLLDQSSPFTSSPLTPVSPSRTHSYVNRRAQPRHFPNARAYRELFQRFSAHPNPYEKLRTLYDFEVLIVSALTASGNNGSGQLPKMGMQMPSSPSSPMLPSSSTMSPLSAVFKDGPVEASQGWSNNHTVRSTEGPQFLQSGQSQFCTLPQITANEAVFSRPGSKPGTDLIVEEMTRILKLAELKPKTLFRDLQYIATFIPANILNMTDEGKVFWDFGLAASSLKHEMVEALTDCACGVLRRNESRHVEALQVNAANSSTEASDFTMAETVTMLAIASKERQVVAMRELGLLLQSSNEASSLCAPIILPPLSMPSEIFGRVPSVAANDSIAAERRRRPRAESMIYSSSVSSLSGSTLPPVLPVGSLGISFADKGREERSVATSKSVRMRRQIALAWLKLASAEGDIAASKHLEQCR